VLKVHAQLCFNAAQAQARVMVCYKCVPNSASMQHRNKQGRWCATSACPTLRRCSAGTSKGDGVLKCVPNSASLQRRHKQGCWCATSACPTLRQCSAGTSKRDGVLVVDQLFVCSKPTSLWDEHMQRRWTNCLYALSPRHCGTSTCKGGGPTVCML
jgi:hypothetical protein